MESELVLTHFAELEQDIFYDLKWRLIWYQTFAEHYQDIFYCLKSRQNCYQ